MTLRRFQALPLTISAHESMLLHTLGLGGRSWQWKGQPPWKKCSADKLRK